MHSQPRTRVWGPQVRAGNSLWVGLAFLAVGLLWTLDSLNFVESEPILRWWPAILIVIGLLRLTGFAGPSRPVWGAILTGVGSLLLMSQFDMIDFGFEELWALGLIFIGGMIVYRSVMGRRARTSETDASDQLNAIAIMAGVERKVQSTAFRGGEATAIMGGVELDFRPTQIQGDEAAIELLVIMGGVEITVPPDWQVVHDVSPVMGAVEDNRKAPPSEGKQRLRLSGFVMMGGVVIKDAPAKG